MDRYAVQFTPPNVDIELPEGLNTEALREWVIRKIDEIDIQRRQYQQILQRYSNTRQGKKQHTADEIALIRAEQNILFEQRTAYRQLLGDLKAAQKELARIQANQRHSRHFAEHFVEVAREALSAQEFNRLFTAARARSTHSS
jgi:hypothetical protein